MKSKTENNILQNIYLTPTAILSSLSSPVILLVFHHTHQHSLCIYENKITFKLSNKGRFLQHAMQL